MQARRSAAALAIQAAARGLAARRRVAQLQQARSALRAEGSCRDGHETAQESTRQIQHTEEGSGAVDALPARSSCSVGEAAPCSREVIAEALEDTASAAGDRSCGAEPGMPDRVIHSMLPIFAIGEGASAGAGARVIGTTPPALAGLDGHGRTCWVSMLGHRDVQKSTAALLCHDEEGQSPTGRPACKARPCSVSHAHAACSTPWGTGPSQRHAPSVAPAHAADCCQPSSDRQDAADVLHTNSAASGMPASKSPRCGTPHTCAWSDLLDFSSLRVR